MKKIYPLAISIVLLFSLTACYDGPLDGVDRHPSLVEGTYESIYRGTGNNDGKRLVLVIGEGTHDSESGSKVTLSIYKEMGDGSYEETPWRVFTGTYTHLKMGKDRRYMYTYDFPYLGYPYSYTIGEIWYHVDQFTFTSYTENGEGGNSQTVLDEMSGKVFLVLNPETARIESACHGYERYWNGFGNNLSIALGSIRQSEIYMGLWTDRRSVNQDYTELGDLYWIIKSASSSST